MKQRRSTIFDRQKDNWYVEPFWVSERLFDVEAFDGGIVDPCAGGGIEDCSWFVFLKGFRGAPTLH